MTALSGALLTAGFAVHALLVDVEQVPVGARIIIKPGDRVPLDGRIIAGETTVNQAPVTGESLPVARAVGDEVFAGTINQDGAIEVSTVKPAAESTISQIIKMVREAQSKRSPSEQWVEKFARYYTPTVMALAIAVAIIPPLVLGSWADWFYQALVLLVIVCPCALVISTPVSIVAALVAAARHGVLIKGGAYVELPSRLNAIGTDAAMETADIALMSDDLSRLPWLVRYSRRVLRVIRQNIFASLAVKVIFVLLTFAGHASLWAAIAADMGTSLLGVFNALRLVRD